MNSVFNYPFLVFALSFILMWLAARIGFLFRSRWNKLEEDAYQDFDLVVAATLTFLGLIIGFSFSMASGRYDQRKNYEEAEANAIGTEYVRADLLPASDRANVRALLRNYLDQRVLFYVTRDETALQKIDADTAQLQTGLWSAVYAPAGAQPTPLFALAVSGMNDVLNSQGYTQAAWRYRIPTAAWCLMVAIAFTSNLLIGFDSRRAKQQAVRMLVLPLVLSIAFLAIADIDSPRRGLIHVIPQNLISLAQSLRGH